VASLLGSAVMNNPTFSKSNAEIRPIIHDCKLSRDKYGAGPLKIFTSDNIDGDGGPWMQEFEEELQS